MVDERLVEGAVSGASAAPVVKISPLPVLAPLVDDAMAKVKWHTVRRISESGPLGAPRYHTVLPRSRMRVMVRTRQPRPVQTHIRTHPSGAAPRCPWAVRANLHVCAEALAGTSQ